MVVFDQEKDFEDSTQRIAKKPTSAVDERKLFLIETTSELWDRELRGTKVLGFLSDQTTYFQIR